MINYWNPEIGDKIEGKLIGINDNTKQKAHKNLGKNIS